MGYVGYDQGSEGTTTATITTTTIITTTTTTAVIHIVSPGYTVSRVIRVIGYMRVIKVNLVNRGGSLEVMPTCYESYWIMRVMRGIRVTRVIRVCGK